MALERLGSNDDPTPTKTPSNDDSSSDKRLKRVLPLYALSGLISLGYQVAWFRIYVDWFGSTNLTFATVLCNFIGGLGLGALASRPLADLFARTLKINDRLRIYGILELTVAATVLFLAAARALPPDLFGSFPYELEGTLYRPTTTYQLARLALAALCVFIPCFFMGATFPLLCSAYSENERFPSTLYAWNTLGACTGVLASEFLFLPRFGHDLTLWSLAGLNGLLGLFFLATGGAPVASQTGVVPPNSTEPSGPPTAARGIGVLLACAILSGFLAGSLEADMFKRVGFLSNKSPAAMSFISFWAILAIFLASFTVRAFRRMSLSHVKGAFLVALTVYFTTWAMGHSMREGFIRSAYAPVVEALSERPFGPKSVAGFFPTSLGQVLAFAGIFVLPTFFLISLLLPYICNSLQASRRHLGVAYGANTLAFCAGMVVFNWLAPSVSIFYSMKLLMLFFAIGCVFLLLLREGQALKPWKPLAAVLAGGIASALTPAGFDVSYMAPGSLPARYPVRAMKSNGSSTTYVVAAPDGDRLYFDNHSMSGTNHAAQVYMRLMAHFPLLAQADPKRALLICFGVGNTADAITSHRSITGLDVVDLNDKVIETAPEFVKYNHGVYADPRVRFIHDDGRNYLQRTTERYDLITSEPPPPLYAGVYRLYSKEYYAEVLDHLTDTGMMTQWLPVHEMPQEAVDLAVATFVDVFPHALLFVGIDMEYILVGSRSELRLDRIAARLSEEEGVASDLARLGIVRPLQLLARVTKGPIALARDFGDLPTISDQNNDLTYVFTEPLAPGVVHFDPREALSELGTSDPEVQDVFAHLGRLRYVAELPYQTLATAPPGSAALADLDWNLIADIQARSSELEHKAVAGDATADLERTKLLEKARELHPEQPDVLVDLASAYAAAGNLQGTLATLRAFEGIEPNDPLGPQRRGLTRFAMGDLNAAATALGKSIELFPGDAKTHAILGSVLAAQGDTAGAGTHFRRAVEIDPNNVEARIELGLTLARSGHPEQAIEAWTAARELDPRNPTVHVNLGLVLTGQGKMRRAVEHLTEAVRLAPALGLAQRSLGMALLQQGNPKAAATHLRRAVELDPSDELARQALGQAEAAAGPG